MSDGPTRPAWSPWRFVVSLGIVSMLADVAYEGARSITGPYLAAIGASALAVGLITGAGEAVGFAGRLASGPLADRTRAYWPLLIAGYAMTVVSVPLLGATSILWIVAGLVLTERAGKAVRRPAKDVILSHATSAVGRGRGFAVHEALDQFGAVIGPVAVAGAFAVTGRYAPTFAMLAVPGFAVIVLLLWLRRRVPDPSAYEAPTEARATAESSRSRGPLPPTFWWYAAFATLTTIGYATFGIIGYHVAREGLASASVVPLIYAGAMLVDAGAALAVGALYDRVGRRVLLVVPLLAAAIPPLAFSSSLALVVTGVALWGAVMGIQESVLRAAVAGLVPAERRGTAYGIFAAALGAAALAGGALVGVLYERSLPLLVGVVVVIQAASLALYAVWARRPQAEVA